MNAAILTVLLAVLGAPGDPPEVRYTVKVVTKSWTPIELKDVETMVEGSALAELTKPGTMRLSRSGFADVKSGDYAIFVDGRFIEEAESFSVYLTFGPGKKSDLPSFHVSDTAAIGGLQRSAMQEKIEALARSSGRKLAAVLAPELEAVRLSAARPPIEDPALPWTWGPIEVPKVSSKIKAVQQLLDVKNPDDVRHEALGSITGQVFDQQPVRNAVELCALRDPSPSIRGRCVEALAPIARNHVPTQRILLHALRAEVDEGVARELAAVTESFVGLSRKECIESWLEMIASDATPSSVAGMIAEVLAKEGDVPNLDLAVAKCLQQEALAYGKKQACAQTLLRVIPKPRRRAVVWTYLERVEVHDQGEANTFEDVLERLSEGRDKIDPALAELLLGIALKPRTNRARVKALYEAMHHPSPTPAFAEKVLQLATDSRMATHAIRAVQEIARTAPDLRGMLAGGLERIRDTVSYFPQKFGGDPNEDLAKAIEQLRREPRK